jgi:uncharacterized ubiquitin-like protein YukD
MLALLLLLLASLALLSVQAMPAVNVVANVRGKKYDISAETVEDFCAQVESLAGIEAAQQNVLFRGKVLGPSDKLEDVGVSAGDILNVVKGRKPRQTNFAAQSTSSKANKEPLLDETFGNTDPKQAQQNAMDSMNALLDSDLEAYFSDSEQLEKARLQMLEKIDEYEKLMPGFRAQAEAIAKDPEEWQKAMQRAKESMLKLKAMRDAGQLTPDMLFGAPSDATSMPDNG